MFTNADCTVLNAYYDVSNRCERWQKTIVRGVYWEDTSGQTSETNGLKSNCHALVIVPKGADYEGKTYKPPREFKRSPEGSFTFAPDDIIVKGVLTGEYSKLSDVTALDGSHTILTVRDFTYGSTYMQHWEVSAE